MKRKVLSLLLTLALCLSLVPLTAVPVSAATVSNVIKSFDFETDPTVEGWTFVDADGDARSWVWSENNSQYSGNGYDGSECIVSRYHQSGDIDNWAISPAVDLSMYTAGDQLELSLYAKKNSDTYVEHFQIWAGTSADKDQMTCISGNEDIVPTSSYARYKADLSAFTGKEMVYVAIRHCNSFDQFNLLVDRVEICKLEEVVSVTEYDLWVGGERVTSANASDLSSIDGVGGTASYDATTNTLTLNNATIKNNSAGTDDAAYSSIYYSGTAPLIISAAGTNTIEQPTVTEDHAYGIYSNNDLVFEGTGIVDIAGSTTGSPENNFGLFVNGNLSILEDCTVNAQAGKAVATYFPNSAGAQIEGGKLTMGGSASATFTGGSAGYSSSGFYIQNRSLTFSSENGWNGSLTVQSNGAGFSGAMIGWTGMSFYLDPEYVDMVAYDTLTSTTGTPMTGTSYYFSLSSSNELTAYDKVVITPAAPKYPLYISGIRVTESNKDNILGSAGTPTAVYDSDKNVLTLNNAVITGGSDNTNNYGYGICYRGDEDLTIVAESGFNAITDSNATRYYSSYGLVVGDPSPLVMTSAGSTGPNVTITVSDGATLNFSGGAVNGNEDFAGSYGILNKGGGTLTINGAGTLIASVSNTNSRRTCGIATGDALNLEGSVTVIAQPLDSGQSYGVSANDVTLSGSATLNSVAGRASTGMSCAIFCQDFTTGTDYTGTVNAIAKDAPATTYNTATYGIRATGDISINGGTVTASTGTGTGSNTSGDYAVGIFGENSLSIVGSTVNAMGDGAGLWCYQGTTSINKADVTAIGYNIATNGLNLISVTAEASTEAGGSNLVEYDDSAYQTYKYVHTKPVTEYNVNVSAGEGGTATVDPTSGPQGTEVTLTATPAEGYQFKEWEVVSGGVTIEDNKFQVGTEDVEIKAIFEVKPNKVAAPVLPKSTTFTDSMTIEITCETEDAEIYYTTGSAITLYVGPFTITETTTVEAHATKTGFDDSDVVTATYTKTTPSGGGGSPATYPVKPSSTENGNITVSPRDAAAGMTVTITVTPDEGYELDKLNVKDKDGNEIEVNEKNGEFTFTMPAAAVVISATFKPEGEEPTPDDDFPFVDVPETFYCRKAVEWALENGVTGGTSPTTFSPKADATRGQTMTFLWAAAGAPEPKTTENPFKDISESDYYYKAVLWAYENGITAGISADEFGPEVTVTRAQVATFLYGIAGRPDAGDEPFTDVNEGDYFEAAVAWAFKEGITTGTAADKFSPDADCLREQIITFMYLYFAE